MFKPDYSPECQLLENGLYMRIGSCHCSAISKGMKVLRASQASHQYTQSYTQGANIIDKSER